MGKSQNPPKEIITEQYNFYSKLYTRDPKVSFNLINSEKKYISDEHYKILEEPITLEELTKTVQELKRNRTPGCTGWTAEFYQFSGQK